MLNEWGRSFVAILQQQHKESVIFASSYSMNSISLAQQFTDAGINLVCPDRQEMIAIDNIRQSIYAGKETRQQIQHFNALLEKYQKIVPVVVACTELSILVRKTKTNVFDMARIQMEDFIAGIVPE